MRFPSIERPRGMPWTGKAGELSTKIFRKSFGVRATLVLPRRNVSAVLRHALTVGDRMRMSNFQAASSQVAPTLLLGLQHMAIIRSPIGIQRIFLPLTLRRLGTIWSHPGYSADHTNTETVLLESKTR